MDISRFITHTPDYHTHVYFKDIYLSTHSFSNFSEQHTYPSPRTGPQDLSVTHYDCEENEQKTLHKYAINQVTQCESEPLAIESTNVIATLYSKAQSTTLTGYKFKAKFSENKIHCSQVLNGNKNRLDHESFYQINVERLIDLSPQDCDNEFRRLNLTQNDGMNRELVNFQVFPDLAHPTTRTQATIVWFPEETCSVFQVPKIHARMIKFHKKY